MKKAALLVLALFVATAMTCSAQEETQAVVAVNVISGSVGSVDIPDATAGISSGTINVTSDAGETVSVVVTPNTMIVDAAQVSISLADIMVNSKVQVKYSDTADGKKEAMSINVL